MNNINFANPYILILLVPVILLIVISYIIAIRKDNRTINNVISFILHLIIGVLVILSFSKTTFEKVITETNIYILADISYSSNDNLDVIDDHINNVVIDAPKNSKIGVICFGKDYELLVPLGEDIISVRESKVDNTETNIASAVEYAQTLFNEGVIKRMVIISDGKETNKSNIASIVQSLSLDDIYIDAIYLNNNLPEDSKEVQINTVDLIDSTFINNEESVYVTIQSSFNTKSYVKLYCDDELYLEKAIALSKGSNIVTFDLNTTTSGVHKYKACVEVEEDGLEINNSYIFDQEVYESIDVLFISDLKEDKQAAEALYSSNNSSDNKYIDINIDYYIKNYEIPYSIEELSVYDEIVLSNVDIRNYKNSSQFIKNVDVLVSDFGKTLLTFGNVYTQNNEDDETLIALGDMLPVKFGSNEGEDKLVTILLDISRSMEELDKLNILKQVACNIVDNLDDETTVYVVAFFGEVGKVIDPTKAKERDFIKNEIMKLEPKQGTFLGSGLQFTYNAVSNFVYSKKEVMLISDGLPYGEQENSAKAVANAMANKNIILSAIHTVNSDGTDLMKELASIGRGYYYYIDDLRDVDSLILDEVLNSLKEVILETNESTVSIEKTKNPLVLGIEELPSIKGLYNNSSKSSAEVVLLANYKDINNNGFPVPLYTEWNYGNGKVGSYASTISGKWVENWASNEDSKEVLINMLPVNKPNEKANSAFIVDCNTSGTITTLSVDAPSVSTDSKVFIDLVYPSGKTITKEMSFDSKYYVSSISTDEVGTYEAVIKYTLGEFEYSSNYSFTISYLPEYNRFQIFEPASLFYMVSTNGEISEDGHLTFSNGNVSIKKYILDFTPIFMTICIILFIIDVIVRKLRLEDIKGVFKKTSKGLNNKKSNNSDNGGII